MEENNVTKSNMPPSDLENVISLVKELGNVVKGFENRIVKNEQLLLQTFSYLYTRHDNLTNELNGVLNNEIGSIKQQYSYVCERLDNINLKEYKQYPIPEKSTKRKRPWHYFISKHFKYKRLLKEREELHLKQEQERERRRKIEEQERIKREEEERIRKEQEKLEQIKREEEAKKQAEIRRKEARKKMNTILQNINKG